MAQPLARVVRDRIRTAHSFGAKAGVGGLDAFSAFVWFDLASGMSNRPGAVALAALALTVFEVVPSFALGGPWTESAEPFSLWGHKFVRAIDRPPSSTGAAGYELGIRRRLASPRANTRATIHRVSRGTSLVPTLQLGRSARSASADRARDGAEPCCSARATQSGHPRGADD